MAIERVVVLKTNARHVPPLSSNMLGRKFSAEERRVKNFPAPARNKKPLDLHVNQSPLVTNREISIHLGPALGGGPADAFEIQNVSFSVRAF